MDTLIGKSIGRYQVIDKLGEGGMATVYKAYDTRLERYVALKVIRAAEQQSETYRIRFEREAKALAQLNHPNIVPVLDYGEYEGMVYFVMVFLSGGTLKQKMTGRAMSGQEAARLLAPIAHALEYAHQHKIIHRDIKPANILFGEAGQPMLSDFGIAKMLEKGDSVALTGTGVGIGTPEYMAPEQGIGGAVDHRTDVYSLGIVFYELITGRKPFQADTPLAILLRQMNEPLPRPALYNPGISATAEAILFKALAKDPNERFQSMSDFAQKLEEVAQGTLSPTSAPATQVETLVRPPATVLQPQAIPPRQTQPTVADPLSTVVDASLQAPPPGGQALPKWLEPPDGRFAPGAVPYPAPRRKSGLGWIWIVVISVVCLGLSGVMLLGTGTIFLAALGASTSTPTPTQRPPTEAPTLTLAPTATSDITGSSTLFFDDFSDPNSGWKDDTWDSGFLSYGTDGKYHVGVTKENWLTYATPGLDLSDVIITVDFTPVSTNQDGSYGVYCRRVDDNNGYMFEFSQKGSFRILKRQNGEYVYLSEFAEASPIPLPPEGGVITASCLGNELSLYINGILLQQLTDDTFGNGDVGVFVSTWGGALEIAFDNFTVQAP
jgi:serine/threonine protein kinase